MKSDIQPAQALSSSFDAGGTSEKGYLLFDLSGYVKPDAGADSILRAPTDGDPNKTSPDRTARHHAHAVRFWMSDILGVIFVFGLLGAIYGLLRIYNTQQVPQWDVAINLNTLIAILSTLLRASLVYIVANIISQAKWGIFARGGPPQPLIRINQLDSASRSLVGAVKLLPLVIQRPMLLFSFIILLASTAIGPFAQQAIKTEVYEFQVDGSAASIPVSYNISDGYNRQAGGQ